MRRALKVLAAATALLVAGCGGGPDYYLLPPPGPAARVGTPVATISVADIGLPSYAEAAELATLTPTGAVELVRDASWADTPRRALTRHLAAALETRLGASVIPEPWPGFNPPALRVEVAVDRMIGAPETGLGFSGQYVILTPANGRIFTARRFDIAVPPQGPGNAGLLALHAEAMDTLADDIAARIAGRRPAS